MMMNQSSLRRSSTNDEIELTSMEIDCLKLAANGHRATQISRQLSVSEQDIEILLYCAERKLGAMNRLHAIGLAVSQGLIGIEGK
jgi:DNA-binding CsgD family transcriptional regulator